MQKKTSNSTRKCIGHQAGKKIDKHKGTPVHEHQLVKAFDACVYDLQLLHDRTHQHFVFLNTNTATCSREQKRPRNIATAGPCKKKHCPRLVARHTTKLQTPRPVAKETTARDESRGPQTNTNTAANREPKTDRETSRLLVRTAKNNVRDGSRDPPTKVTNKTDRDISRVLVVTKVGHLLPNVSAALDRIVIAHLEVGHVLIRGGQHLSESHRTQTFREARSRH